MLCMKYGKLHFFCFGFKQGLVANAQREPLMIKTTALVNHGGKGSS